MVILLIKSRWRWLREMWIMILKRRLLIILSRAVFRSFAKWWVKKGCITKFHKDIIKFHKDQWSKCHGVSQRLLRVSQRDILLNFRYWKIGVAFGISQIPLSTLKTVRLWIEFKNIKVLPYWNVYKNLSVTLCYPFFFPRSVLFSGCITKFHKD